MQEPVRDIYRSFSISIILRHLDDMRIETTVFIDPTSSTPPNLASKASCWGGSVLHTIDAATPITDQIKAAHAIVDKIIAQGEYGKL